MTFDALALFHAGIKSYEPHRFSGAGSLHSRTATQLLECCPTDQQDVVSL